MRIGRVYGTSPWEWNEPRAGLAILRRARPDRPRHPIGVDLLQELVARARRGDHDAFAALAAAKIGRLDAAARLILRDPDKAKDAVQETLVRAWRDLPTLRSNDRFDAWLHRLLVRSCIDEARRLRRHRFDVELTSIDVAAADDSMSSMADRDQLDRGFDRLEPEARALIVLHHYLDLPMSDVAHALGIPLGTAKSRLHRALGSMRAALDADARPLAELPAGTAGMTEHATSPDPSRPGSTSEQGGARPAISTRSWSARPGHGNGPPGRASKGGSQWTQGSDSTPVPRLAWLLVVLALVVALSVIAVVGSQPRNLPAPFGPARNGLILVWRSGRRDPCSGRREWCQDHPRGRRRH